MKLYIDTKDIGKTVSYKEENGKKQYLYAHDKEGFELKDIADYTKQVRKEVCEGLKKFIKDNSTAEIRNRGTFYVSVPLDKLNEILDQIQGKNK